ncbi:transporter substrate-binding domain-containing protein [Vibrio tritonius]|uniref:Transporter substrate-binding domain-containing protein n=1 Tax=Vibrio tritonius TaxID=1435069 RepID=A0ABS7YNZ0_9VIBR|nr:transporter substrate-binding domain-containing protein [Vibrio tritonius]MCA2017400.1 transporter substrate-binding domain-containing protein [Vibrio tritonius]
MTSKKITTAIRRTFIGAALIASAATSVSASAESNTVDQILKSGELRLCFEAGYIPFEMTAKNGQYVGFDIDVAKHLARSLGVKFVPVNTAWDGIVPALKTNKCDFIAGMTVTPERNLSVLFADDYLKMGQTILISPKLKDKIHSYRDLNNKNYTVATQMGTSSAIGAEKYLFNARVDLYDTSADAVLQVMNGKADAFVYDLPYNAMYAAQHKDQVIHLDKPFTFEPMGWAIRRGDHDFLNLLNNYMKQIRGDGTYDRIYAKWFKSDKWLSKVQ